MASAMIYAIRSTQGQQPAHRRLPEKLTMTFLEGVPVEVEPGGGYLIEWDGTTYTGVIAGISKEAASSLAASGVPKTLTYGSVPNQSSAVKIPMGAPLNDGRCAVDLAVPETVFLGQVKSDQVVTQANVGNSYGLTKDADNHWYVDLTKTTTSGDGATNQAVLKIVGLGPGSVSAEGVKTPFDSRAVQFVFLAAACQNLG